MAHIGRHQMSHRPIITPPTINPQPPTGSLVRKAGVDPGTQQAGEQRHVPLDDRGDDDGHHDCGAVFQAVGGGGGGVRDMRG